MTGQRRMVSAYVSAHFLVDFACAFFMFGTLYTTEQWYIYVLLYNFCAFAMQMPIGLLADKCNLNVAYASGGCVLAALAFAFRASPIPAVLLAGIGNAMFHVGGGLDVLNHSKEKASTLGVFVAPGAFGIFFGTMLGKQNFALNGVFMAALLAAGALLALFAYAPHKTLASGNPPVSFEGAAKPSVCAAAACFFFIVCLRSYLGMLFHFPWSGKGIWGVMMVCAVVFGKAAGGFLADKAGAMRASVLSLAGASALFLFSAYPLAGIAAVFLFNMTMPITLWAMARLFPNAKGFSFGLLTFALFLGFVPVLLGCDPLFTSAAGFAAASLFSLLFLWTGLRKAVRA